ncbi:MAG: protein kinase [Bryobacteraceae bacterium]
MSNHPQSLGHYRILHSIGEGGMGVVYKALDTHLDRSVALKVLSEARTTDEERRRRFVQEAKAASALNHPNIVTIYDIGRDNETDYISMEFVDGKTLADSIPRSGMKLSEALAVATQICDALAKAHAAGITHRDLKPGNIMLDAAGRVKILDFGLAKLTDKPESTDSEKTLVHAPTTTEGTILGTVNYMSPEQAEGKKVDWRSDVFSFGAVLYEMVTGQRAFHGDTPMSTLAAVIHKEPKPLHDLAPVTPAELDRIIRRCLRKDRERRYHSMADVRNALDEIAQSPSEAPPPAEPARRGWLWLTAGLCAGLAVAAAFEYLRPKPPSQANYTLRRLTADAGLTFEPALSPDGKLIAFASDRSGDGNLDIWVQHISGGDAIRLTNHEADDQEPSFSPDGGRIVFRSGRSGGGIYAMPTLGGDARLIAPHGFRPRFSPDGTKIAYHVTARGAAAGTRLSELYVVEAQGGQPKRLADGFGAGYPVWSPDGLRILFQGGAIPKPGEAARRNLWIVPAGGGDPVPVASPDYWRTADITPILAVPDAWSSDGRWLYLSVRRSGVANIWRVPLDSKGTVRGIPEQVTIGTTDAAHVSLSKDGVMAFSSAISRAGIWAQPGNMNTGKISGPPLRISTGIAVEERPRVSKDGRKLAYVSDRSQGQKIYLKDLATGKETLLSGETGFSYWPVISGDGSRVGFDKQDGLYLVQPPANPERVRKTSNPWDISVDGRFVLVDGGTRQDIVAFDFVSRRESLVAKRRQMQLLSPVFSHDMRWIALHTRNSEVTRQIHILPFHENRESLPQEWIPITDDKGLERDPEWSPDGNLLYWQTDRDGFRCFIAQKLDPATKRPVGEPFFVQHFHDPSRSLQFFANTGASSPTIAPDRMYYAIGERTGNVWLMQPQGQQ